MKNQLKENNSRFSIKVPTLKQTFLGIGIILALNALNTVLMILKVHRLQDFTLGLFVVSVVLVTLLLFLVAEYLFAKPLRFHLILFIPCLGILIFVAIQYL